MQPISIPMDDPTAAVEEALASCLGDLESISTETSGSTRVTLYTAVRDFLNSNQVARQAQTNIEVADENAASISERLYRHLKDLDFDCSLLVCTGFKKKLDKCSPNLDYGIHQLGYHLIADDLIHFAVRVGNVVIDLGFRRLGTDYMNSNNTVFNHYTQAWKKVTVVPSAYCDDRTHFLRYVRTLLSQTKLRKALESGDGPGMTATAGALVDAFGSGAKRNRKMRCTPVDGTKGLSRISVK